MDIGLRDQIVTCDVRDSIAPRSYVYSWSQAFSDSWAWLRKARRYIG